jgi:hypothetical protein
MIHRLRNLALVVLASLLSVAAAVAQNDTKTASDPQSPAKPTSDGKAGSTPASPSPSGAQGPTEPQSRPTAPGDPSKDAQHFGSPMQLPSDATRESMWPAPTADDWKKPCLIQWQRTWEDAVKVSKATHKPIMICVNMDGEIASEHFAGIRYRTSETAKLYEPYVCVVASVYRHNPRDYDLEGNRIPCPRFGTVTCGEHIAIEPLLFDKYFDGKRIAPRHIEIDLDQKRQYDVYFSWDTQTVFTEMVKGLEGYPPATPILHDDVPMIERVASPDVVDREAVELAYRQGSRDVRRTLIESATTHRDIDQIDLLRQAIFGLDLDLARLGREALMQSDAEGAVDLIAEVLKLPLDPKEREDLIAAEERLSTKYPRAGVVVAVNRGLAGPSKLVDVQAWSRSMQQDYDASARAAREVAARLEGEVEAAHSRPADAAARLELAKSFLARAENPETGRRFADAMVEDARNAALEAERLGAQGWELHALLSIAASKLKDRDQAQSQAVLAIEGGMPAPAATDGFFDRESALVFASFAHARQAAIVRAYREKKPWPPEWISDIHAAYTVLLHHPLGTDQNVVDHYDFLSWMGATPRAVAALDEGLEHFPDSWILHDRLRTRTLEDRGPDGLEAEYTARLEKENAPAGLEWFAGYASLVAAEAHRRAKHPDLALRAYDRGTAHYEKYIAAFPANKDNAEHYIALALAGRARIALERGDLDASTADILASFQAKPSAAASLDGLNISPVDTAKMLRSKLVEAKRVELSQQLQAALDELDPRLLELPAYERNVQGRGEQPRSDGPR